MKCAAVSLAMAGAFLLFAYLAALGTPLFPAALIVVPALLLVLGGGFLFGASAS